MKKKKQLQNTEDMLSPEEREMLEKSAQADGVDRSTLPHYDNSDGAKLIRYAKAHKPLVIVCAVLAVSIIALVIVCAAVFGRIADTKENTDDFTLILGDGKYTKKTMFTVKYEDTVKDGVVYIDMFKVADYTGLTVSGSKTSVKFTSNEENYLRFEDKSNEAVINGSRVELGGTAHVSADVCEIPYEFLTKAVGNALKFTLDRETNTITIQRRVSATAVKDVFVPLDMLFHTDAFNVLMGIVWADGSEQYEYSIDVSAFLSAIEPKNKNEYLILANKQTPLGENYVPAGLKVLTCETAGKTMSLRADAADALYAMMLAMRADGITDTFVTSAYRSYSYQVGLWEGYVADHIAKGMSREEAEAAADEYSARAGKSEHQTGLCLDFMTTSMTDLDETFEDTAAFDWLSENAYKFGFILRYPADKVSTTGYKYEPWHYRFVGRTVATEIYNSGLCLEEYLELN